MHWLELHCREYAAGARYIVFGISGRMSAMDGSTPCYRFCQNTDVSGFRFSNPADLGGVHWSSKTLNKY